MYRKDPHQKDTAALECFTNTAMIPAMEMVIAQVLFNPVLLPKLTEGGAQWTHDQCFNTLEIARSEL